MEIQCLKSLDITLAVIVVYPTFVRNIVDGWIFVTDGKVVLVFKKDY